MACERFNVPEVLFNPSNIGINQSGLAEAITQVVSKCPEIFAKELYKNIILGGGNAAIPGIKERLESELVPLTGEEEDVNILQL